MIREMVGCFNAIWKVEERVVLLDKVLMELRATENCTQMNPVPTVDSNVQRYVLDSGSRAIALMSLNFETKLYIGRIKWFLWFENFK